MALGTRLSSSLSLLDKMAAAEEVVQPMETTVKAADETNTEEKPTQKEAIEDAAEAQSVNGNKENGDENGTAKDALAPVVAKHYNARPQASKESRKDSRIYHLRNFNNWVKSVLINEFLEKFKRNDVRDMNVLDLACGKGGDLLKWAEMKGRIKKLIFADIAEVSVDHAKKRYKELQKSIEEDKRHHEPLFDTQYIVADCTKEQISQQFDDPEMQLDLTSCQFSFHYSFESYEQADMMLKNACEKLKVGGYFIGTTPNSYELVHRLRQSENNSFGNEVYNITFENKEEFPIFGCKYNFHLEGVVDCPEFLVYFPLLEKMAEKYNMKLLFAKSFSTFFQEKSSEYNNLLSRMNALETYPPRRDDKKLLSTAEDAYVHAKDFLEGLQVNQPQADPSSKYRDHRVRSPKHVGTLSKAEWEAACLYLAFAFVKIDPEAEKRKAAEEAAAAAAKEQKQEEEEEEDNQQQEKAEEAAEPSEAEATESRKRKRDDSNEGDGDEGEPSPKKQETSGAE